MTPDAGLRRYVARPASCAGEPTCFWAACTCSARLALALAALCLWLRDPPRGSQDAPPPTDGAARGANDSAPPVNGGARAAEGARFDIKTTYLHLLRNRPYVFTVLGYAAYTFALGGLASWMPAFLERVRGMSPDRATVQFGEIVVITGFVGTFVGGWLGDYCAKYSKQAYLCVSAVATLVAAPFAWIALTVASSTEYLVCMVMAQLLMFLSTGPINACIVNIVLPNQRASAGQPLT